MPEGVVGLLVCGNGFDGVDEGDEANNDAAKAFDGLVGLFIVVVVVAGN